MKQSELLRKQADMMDMAEKYGIDDWKDLISVDNSFGVREKLYSIDWLYSYDLSKPKFALGVVEGKPVFEGDVLYDNFGVEIASSAWTDSCFKGLSWTQPKPKTVMVELLREDAELYASQSAHLNIAKACRKALEEQK